MRSGLGAAGFARRMRLRFSFSLAMLPALLASTGAIAQVGAMVTTPTLGATSPLGVSPGTSVGPTGIPLGSTEITSPGESRTHRCNGHNHDSEYS